MRRDEDVEHGDRVAIVASLECGACLLERHRRVGEPGGACARLRAREREQHDTRGDDAGSESTNQHEGSPFLDHGDPNAKSVFDWLPPGVGPPAGRKSVSSTVAAPVPWQTVAAPVPCRPRGSGAYVFQVLVAGSYASFCTNVPRDASPPMTWICP